MKKLSAFLIIFLMTLFTERVLAVDEIFTKGIQGSNITVNKKFKVKDDKFQTADTTTIDTTLGINNLIIFELNEDTNLVLPASFVCTIELQVVYWNRAGVKTTEFPTLTISYDSTRINPFNYRTIYLEKDYYKDSVKVLNIIYLENGIPDTFPPIFRLTAEIQISRIYNFDCSEIPKFIKTPTSAPDNGFLFSKYWQVFDGADEYDFEWTFYDDSSVVAITYATDSASVNFEDLFLNNATRVVVKTNNYTINKIYTGGTIYYRVRAVHYDAYGNRITTPWTARSSTGGSSITRKFDIDWYHPDFNWTASTVFSEEGKKNATVSYFDGSQRSRQTVSTVNTDTFSLVSQTIYDHQGRSALTVLPVPVKAWNTYYHSLFNKHGGDVYDRTHFDIGDCGFIPLSMDSTTGGASKYYSSNTESSFPFHNFVPIAGGYPFAITEYTPDLTGRIRRQSSVGFPLRFGSGHETRYYYGTPAQEELDMVFGNEAGVSGHYLKNLVIDPNEQISVSYLDAHGRTIATALSGTEPNNLNPLPTSVSPHTLTIDLLKNNQHSAPFSTNHYSLLASHTDDYQFHYEASKEEWEPGCMDEDTCYDCYYDFLLHITDNCGNATLPGDTAYIVSFNNFPDGDPTPFDTVCNNSDGEVTEDFTIAFEPGSYEIHKTATISQQAIDFYAQKYLEQNTCIIPFDTFLSQAMDAIDFDGCNLTCEECNESIGTEADYIESFIADIILSEKEPTESDTIMAQNIYNQMVNECAQLCDGISSCDLLYEQMLQDVSLGGQYGSYNFNNTTHLFTSTNPTSVFTSHWQDPDPPYQDELGNQSYILYLNDSLWPPEDVPLTTFLSHWQPSWAQSLVKYHPEFCYWEFCDSNDVSEDYNESMLNVSTFEEAFDLGFLDPLAYNPSYPQLRDSFFVVGGIGHDVKPDMKAKMDFYFFDGTDTYTMWEFAAMVVSCKGETGCAGFGEACDGDNDQQWKLFRSFYLNAKYYFVDSLREIYVSDTPCHSNKCIGLGDRPWLINNTYIDFSECDTSMYYTGYQPHVIHWNTYGPSIELDGDTTELLDSANAFSSELIAQSCDSACYHNVETWITELSGCFPPFIDMEAFRAALFEVCSAGCSLEHPYGVTSLPGSDTTINGYNSLADVLDTFNLSLPGDTTSCNALNLTISDPSDAFSATTVITIDSCLCAQIAEYKEIYDITSNYQALSDSILANYGYTMTAEDLGMLDSACTVADCHYLREPIHIAPMMVCGKQECIDCETMSYYHSLFMQTFLTSDFSLYPTLFTNFLNDQLGFALTTEDYASFMDSCGVNGFCFPTSASQPDIDTTFDGLNYTYTITWDLEYDHLSQTFFSEGIEGFSIISNQYPYEISGTDTIVNLLDDSLHLIVIDSSCALSQFPIGIGPPVYQIDINFDNINIEWPSFPNTNIDLTICSSCLPFVLKCELKDGVNEGIVFQVLDTINGSCFESRTLCNVPVLAGYTLDTTDCMDQLISIAAANAQSSYQSYLDSVTQAFITNYITECMELEETFTVKEPFNEHHFTLYYYDQAGNLVKTIPPRGVDTLNASERADVAAHRINPISNPAKYPSHVDSTRYWYNSLNKPIKQSTIDGGITQFWYDRIGRLVVSQNAKQEPDDLYSYTIYDDLGRINEVGQLEQNHVMKSDTSISPAALSLWIENGTDREQVTRTFYDEEITALPDLTQENLRNRVATVTFQKVYDADPEVYDHASHYSYDIAGNVKTLVQDIPELEPYTQRFKRIDYEYDLISGKVNNVYYQKDSIDQFIHQYAYDEENRIIQTKTSADGLLWDIDADYQYYYHGPLARIELGELQVQGVDHAYTIQGWLKGINGLNLNFKKDIARDGNPTFAPNKKVGRDVFGMVIGYFAGDYFPAGGSSLNFEPSYASTTFSSASPSLFNGNIRNIGYTIKGLTPLTIGYAYEYDQLNRLTNLKPYDTFDGANYKWSTSGSGMTAYKETLTYDANGNIVTYLRKGAVSELNMDNMTYNYTSGTNKLLKVTDLINSGNYPNDIDNQSTNNYFYDNSGNLIEDKKQKLDITWTAYGKVDSIYNDVTDLAINFEYDASQNRLSKRVIATASSDTTSTYYIRDAQGNIMAMYELKEDTVRWIEQDLYGSSRLGVLNPDSVVYPPTSPSQYFYHLQGKKQYELTNHLGNVLTTINDRKIGQDTTSDGKFDYWLAAQISAQDYYSGGMVMPDRSFSYENYRFSFNGKEDDREANIGYQDYGLRSYDRRLGRFFSVDPLTKDYPWYSPFQFAGNSPIGNIDRDGAEPRSYMDELVWHHETNTKWQYTVYTVYDNLTEQYHTIMNQPNSNQWFYWKNNDGGEGHFTGDNKDENGQWTGRWKEYKTAERIRQENMYAFADFGQKAVANSFIAIGTLGIGLEAGTAAALIGFSTRSAGLKGLISTLTQVTAHQRVDFADVAGDAFIGRAFGNAIFNTTINIGYDFKKGEPFGSISPLNGEYVANFVNTGLWSAVGNKTMNVLSPLVKEGLERATMETLTTLPTTVGEEGIQKAMEKK